MFSQCIMEEWKTFATNYEISNLGNCRRVVKGGHKLIKGTIKNNGYRYTQIIEDGKPVNKYYHVQVLKCFVGDRPAGFCIDHINRDKLDNRLENLRYATYAENSMNSARYRTDIEETDKIKRRRLLAKLKYADKVNALRDNRLHEETSQEVGGASEAVQC